MKKTVFSVAATVALTGVFATTVSADANEHTINKGETLWGISQQYNVSVNDLKSWNNLNSNLIYPNQTLTVSSEAKSSNSSSTKSSNTSTYTVKSGDTLYAISQKFNTSVDQLMAWNNLTSTLIHPGDQFKVDGQAVKTSTPSSTSTTTKTSTNTSTATQTSTSQDSGNDVIKEFTAEATAYTAYCTGCSGVTATGIDLKANPNQKVIAVDPNVIPLGSKVYVEGYGTAIAGDTGGAINGNRIDIFMPSREDALSFGRQSVKVQVLAD
ncbi:3D (Asp-Asp-Asp) domain-containing protein [Halobacillus dabanensis]|uniref:3D (Asp-Asp-Asp) domain-containing protein n=1 Tax=Halobacillus dabanensis TaxID=240302 RepID=A0A1I3VW18_HALDA|nr:3D domain-containing protein [Halobacillus dabanensis]SFJ98331.1 3D (Asp-Asp-Asp) domain-containing protein [Halobacillus dabanensis]